MKEDTSRIIGRLQQAIRESGLSFVELEKRTGFAKSSLQRYASGTTTKIPINCIQAVAKATHVSPEWIMGWDTNEPRRFEMHRIPLVGTIACGAPILADENIEEYIDIADAIRCDFALRCKGDSMINARIFDGDVVFIEQTETVENGEIAAVLIGDEATLKKVYMYPNRIELRAENPLYKSIDLEGDEMQTVQILGRAVWFLSRVQ